MAAEVRERAASAHELLTAQIRGMADAEWTARVPYESERRRTIGNLLGSITGAPKRPFGHVFAHDDRRLQLLYLQSRSTRLEHAG